MTTHFTHSSVLCAPTSTVFDWHTRDGALQRLNPPWAPAEVIFDDGSLEPGSKVVLEVPVGPIRRTWVAEHVELREGRRFRDVQRSGPFAAWDHLHEVRAEPDGATRLTDSIEYREPFGWLGRLLAGRHLSRQLQRTFGYRHRVLASDLERHRGTKPMNVAVTGSSGLVGSALVPFLTTGGHAVRKVLRRDGRMDLTRLEGLDAVVHLAGENIAARRWNKTQKARIRDSRVQGTRDLAEALAKLERKPSVLVVASAIGLYGDRGDTVLEEDAAPGEGFLADVVRDWEAAAEAARSAGIRVVHLRFGVILSPTGGALAKMLTPFRMGLGGRIGSGRQIMSWVALDDAIAAVLKAMTDEEFDGPVNVVAPAPVTNAEFTDTLARVLRRPAIAPMPAFAARLAFGQMADELLLASTRAAPAALRDRGFRFDHPTLEGALRHMLGR